MTSSWRQTVNESHSQFTIQVRVCSDLFKDQANNFFAFVERQQFHYFEDFTWMILIFFLNSSLLDWIWPLNCWNNPRSTFSLSKSKVWRFQKKKHNAGNVVLTTFGCTFLNKERYVVDVVCICCKYSGECEKFYISFDNR